MRRSGRFGMWTGVTAALLMVGTLAVGAVSAQQSGGQNQPAWQGRGPGMGRMGPGMRGMGLFLPGMRQLNLTDDQKQQIKTIFSNHKDDFKAIADRARPARQALQDAIASGDEAAIRQHSSELAAVQTDRALLASKVHAEVFKVLTPEQQQKAQTLIKQFEQRRAARGPAR